VGDDGDISNLFHDVKLFDIKCRKLRIIAL
jgi:hypothetical protein